MENLIISSAIATRAAALATTNENGAPAALCAKTGRDLVATLAHVITYTCGITTLCMYDIYVVIYVYIRKLVGVFGDVDVQVSINVIYSMQYTLARRLSYLLNFESLNASAVLMTSTNACSSKRRVVEFTLWLSIANLNAA